MNKMRLNIQLFGTTASVQSAKYDGRYLKLTLEETATSIENNTSTISWKFESTGGSSSYYSIYNYGVYINGSQVYDGTSGDKTKNYTNHTFPVKTGNVTGTLTITHNADGTASAVPFELHGKVYKSGSATFTGSLALTTIPRASIPTLNYSSRLFGEQVIISTNRYSSSFTHTLEYTFAGGSGTIATNVGASYTWTIPNSLMNSIPNATSGTCVITCKTYSGTTLIGSKSVSLILSVPLTVIPTISNVSLQEVGDVPSTWGVWVQGKSKIKATITASGTYSSTISKYTSLLDGYTLTGNPVTTGYLQNSGYQTYSNIFQVTDSRNRVGKYSLSSNFYFYSYNNPTITTAQVQRCDVSGNIDKNGQYMYVSYGASINRVGGKQDYLGTFKIGYRVHGTGSYTYITLASSTYQYSASGVLFSDGIKSASSSGTKVQFSTNNTYDIIFYAQDYFNPNGITNLQLLDSGFDLMNFNASGKSMAIGKVSEATSNEEKLEIGLDIYINEVLYMYDSTNNQYVPIEVEVVDTW